jgi:hypothetical protein
MFHRPSLTYALPARTPGSFGVSPIALVFDWLTQTWFRFGAFLLWIPLVAVITSAPLPVTQKIAFFLLSPVAACFYLTVMRLLFFVLMFIPGLGQIVGWARLAYYYIFSRFICQPVPAITLPLWFANPHQSSRS